jgi:PBP1b-binding outer membrane lipoprotein LpoB
MSCRLILVALTALVLAGCSNLGCAGADNGRAGAGGCTAHVQF